MSDVEKDLAAVARIAPVSAILRTIRETTGLRYTLVARVLPHRWIACAVHDDIDFGLKVGGELDVATTLCKQVHDTHQPVIIDHASVDPVFCGHPTPKMYGFESYVAVPLYRQNKEFFGTLCGLDPLPLKLSDEKTLAMFTLFSELISLQLEAEDRDQAFRVELRDEKETARLREEFIAVLGHDLRNPLSSIVMGTQLLLSSNIDASQRRTLERIRSSSKRIEALVDDTLDLARGRLGGGITTDVTEVRDIEARLRHVITEIQSSHPNREIQAHFALTGSLRCDARRIEQLLSNLLANAIEHGDAKRPIVVDANTAEDLFTMRVTNSGQPLAEDLKAKLFQPFFRGQSTPTKGLGLGLYIVSEIARAHRGRMDVESNANGTSFVFSMPRQ